MRHQSEGADKDILRVHETAYYHGGYRALNMLEKTVLGHNMLQFRGLSKEQSYCDDALYSKKGDPSVLLAPRIGTSCLKRLVTRILAAPVFHLPHKSRDPKRCTPVIRDLGS